ncbi:hypothetical protein K438DRAFT_1956395 [Mycena galopus ATCC 62051]|nr:hypothetical protein K438DRAFT_1956395 [Mycena galopus ATCC 62051]
MCVGTSSPRFTGVEANVEEPVSDSGTADNTNTAGDSNGEGKDKAKKKSKKSNLIQRFKEKMHVGGWGSSS